MNETECLGKNPVETLKKRRRIILVSTHSYSSFLIFKLCCFCARKENKYQIQQKLWTKEKKLEKAKINKNYLFECLLPFFQHPEKFNNKQTPKWISRSLHGYLNLGFNLTSMSNDKLQVGCQGNKAANFIRLQAISLNFYLSAVCSRSLKANGWTSFKKTFQCNQVLKFNFFSVANRPLISAF